MNENTVLRKIESIEEEIKSLVGAVRLSGEVLRNVSDKLDDKISRQVFKMDDLALRWNCSSVHAREIVSHYNIPLVLSKNHRPRRPHCVMLSEILKFERSQCSRPKHPVILAPPIGKSARGFLPFKRVNNNLRSVVRRLGDLENQKGVLP